MRRAMLALSVTAFSAASAAPLPRDAPGARQARPLEVEPAAGPDGALETLGLLERALELSAGTFVELTRDAAGAERALHEARAFTVEGPLRDALSDERGIERRPEAAEGPSLDERIIALAEDTAAESQRLDRLAAVLDELGASGAAVNRPVLRALTRLEDRLGRLRGLYPPLRERCRSLDYNTARQLERLGADRLARTARLQHAVRGLDWQITRLLARIRALRGKD